MSRIPSQLVVLILLGHLLSQPVASAERTDDLNVVLILADDLGWGDVGCYNPESKIPTPNLDRLASEGMRFTDAHSSCAVCIASRFSLMTGYHAFRMKGTPHPEPELRARYGGNQPTKPLIAADDPTLPESLAKAGYVTSMIGKWHLGFGDLLRRPRDRLRGGPIDRGFLYYFGIPSSLDIDPYVFIEQNRVVAPATVKRPAHRSDGWPDPRMGEFWRGGHAAPGFRHAGVLPELTRRAEAELRRLASEPNGRPFFFYYALPAPHTPLVPSQEFRGQTSIGIYGDYVAQTDHDIGRLLRVLDEAECGDDTLVIVTSDNGPFWYPENVERTGHSAGGPWRGMKGDAWEAGHRVPFIVRWPGHVRPGGVSDEVISLTDLRVTIAGIVGIPHPPASDGIDFSPALRGQKWDRSATHPLVCRSSQGANLLRIGRWVFIDTLGSGGFSPSSDTTEDHKGPEVQLYDLTADPSQQRNLATSHPERVTELQSRVRDMLASGRENSREPLSQKQE